MSSGHDKAVEELLSRKRLNSHSCGKSRVVLAGVRSGAGQLIRASLADAADHEVEVKLRRNKCSSELVKHLRIAGWIVVVKIIDRIDDSKTEKLTPQAIDRRAG